MKDRVTRLDYCQYLLSTPMNYTMTHFADHSERFSHDAINRYARGDEIVPRMVWESVAGQIVTDENGSVVFNDVVLDKSESSQIELVRQQWSGNAKAVIKGIGVVTCVYVNPKLDRFWIIDFRIFAPEIDGKSKLDHMRDMLEHTVTQALPGGIRQALINRQDTASVLVQPTQPLFSIGNRVWYDTNDDGAVGPGVVAGPVNVLMQLVDAGGSVVQTQLTDANGYYRFDNLPAGTYGVIVAASNFQTSGLLAGYRNSSGVTTTTDLGSDNHDHGLNTSPNPSVDGVASVSVTLGLGLQPTGETAVGGGTDGPHGDANSNLTLDFGFNRQQLGNQLWFDTNNNGIFDAGELPVPAGVIVNLHAILFGVDSIALTATTNISGQYEFEADNNVDYSPALVAAGALTIYVAIPAGQPALNSYIPSTPRQTSGGIDNHNVGALDATGLITSGTFYLFPGDTTNGAVISDNIGLTDQPTFDFGFVLETYSVGNRVWFDTNDNGILDAGEQPIAGVSMDLLDGNGDIISTTLTDATGYYRFDNLLAGTYAVEVDDSNFAAQGNVLFGYRSSTGATASSANTADDNHDHGINTGHPGLTGLSSSQFALGHDQCLRGNDVVIYGLSFDGLVVTKTKHAIIGLMMACLKATNEMGR